MKKFCIAFFALAAVLASCRNKELGAHVEPTNTENDSLSEDAVIVAQSLNDIRFSDFTNEDWLDNEYLHELRMYIDNYCKGDILNEELEPYKDYMRSKFVVLWAEPFIMGGLFVKFSFLDFPTQSFAAWVYSSVDEDKGEVTGYEVRSIHVDEEFPDMTKEEILEIVKEHPELKLW